MKARKRVRINPPECEVIWDDGVEEEIFDAAEEALQSGAPAAQVYCAVEGIRPETEAFPRKLERMLLAHGLSPDTQLPSGLTLLLEKLKAAHPPP